MKKTNLMIFLTLWVMSIAGILLTKQISLIDYDRGFTLFGCSRETCQILNYISGGLLTLSIMWVSFVLLRSREKLGKILEGIIFWFFSLVAFIAIIFIANHFANRFFQDHKDLVRLLGLLIAYLFVVYCFFVENDVSFLQKDGKKKEEKNTRYKRIFPCFDIPSCEISSDDDFEKQKKKGCR